MTLTQTRELFARLGQFDHLVFTAGETLQLGSLATTDVDAARRFFTLRYWGAYCAAKYGSASLRKGGSIVFTSGIAGQRPDRGWSLGASICAAMEGLTRALAVDSLPFASTSSRPASCERPCGRTWQKQTAQRCISRRRTSCRSAMLETRLRSLRRISKRLGRCLFHQVFQLRRDLSPMSQAAQGTYGEKPTSKRPMYGIRV
jgi:NAD(P)-dependent dehydrogenase (short-subunit alcohol dehydrogenase family)